MEEVPFCVAIDPGALLGLELYKLSEQRCIQPLGMKGHLIP